MTTPDMKFYLFSVAVAVMIATLLYLFIAAPGAFVLAAVASCIANDTIPRSNDD